LVEEQRAAPRRLEHAGGIGNRAGERAAPVAEELAGGQLLRETRAVDRHERTLPPRALVVDRPRHQLFAGTRLTLDPQRDVGRSHPLHEPDDPLDRLASPHEIAEAALLVEQPAEAVHLRNVDEEEYLPLGSARVVLDLDLDHRGTGLVSRQADNDLLPP